MNSRGPPRAGRRTRWSPQTVRSTALKPIPRSVPTRTSARASSARWHRRPGSRNSCGCVNRASSRASGHWKKKDDTPDRHGRIPYQVYLDETLATADPHTSCMRPRQMARPGGSTTSVKQALYEYADTGTPQPHPFPLMVGVERGYESGENHRLVSVCATQLPPATNSASKFEGTLSQTGHTVLFGAEGRDNRNVKRTPRQRRPRR